MSTKDGFDKVLAELRDRAEGGKGRESKADGDALARALHELDVHHAELEIQNQDLRETQLELARSRDKFQRLFDEAPLGVITTTLTGVVLEGNRAAVQLLRPQQRLTNKPFVVFLAEGQAERYFKHVSAVVESTVPQSAELTVRIGSELRLVNMRTTTMNTVPVTLVSYLLDVTDQRAAEQAKLTLDERLRQSEKLEAIGRVAANIAHDVNNILVSVISLGEFAKVQAPAARADLDALTDAAWRGARLMRGLLGLSRGTGGSARVFEVGGLVRRVAGMLKHSRSGIEVVCEVCDEPLAVLGEEDALLQALLNLGTNGLEAMTQGTLTLRCLAQDGQALVEVQDEGVGMDTAQQGLIFEPLFTTKSAQGGSGLGLTIVQQVVRAFGGNIRHESVPGRGTTFRVLLPTTQSLPRDLRQSSPASRALLVRVLLVDDDDQVRLSTKRSLEAAGATVFPYGNPMVALEEVVEGQLAFDVALLDVNMPELSGPDLAVRLRENLGPIPVVLVTGATGDLIPGSESSRKEVRVLRKPWSREDLVGALAEVLGATG